MPNKKAKKDITTSPAKKHSATVGQQRPCSQVDALTAQLREVEKERDLLRKDHAVLQKTKTLYTNNLNNLKHQLAKAKKDVEKSNHRLVSLMPKAWNGGNTTSPASRTTTADSAPCNNDNNNNNNKDDASPRSPEPTTSTTTRQPKKIKFGQGQIGLWKKAQIASSSSSSDTSKKPSAPMAGVPEIFPFFAKSETGQLSDEQYQVLWFLNGKRLLTVKQICEIFKHKEGTLRNYNNVNQRMQNIHLSQFRDSPLKK